jgi:Flp pilus assembly protein TadG
MTMTRLSLMIRQAIRRFLVGEDGIAGSALIEFTLVAPLLVVMSIYTMDFGLVFYRQMQVQNAAQAGVDWAIANHRFNPAGISAAVTNATNYPDISVSTGYPIEQCACPSKSGVTFTTSNNPAPAGCPTCTGFVGLSVGGLYVTVQTQATYSSFIRYGLFSSATRTLTAQSMARIQ